MKTITILLALTLTSNVYSHFQFTSEINEMLSGLSICSDSENFYIYEKMYKTLSLEELNSSQSTISVEVSHYFISLKSKDTQCDVYVDPYEGRCYTAICK
jgi:hypothetical protein